MSRNHSTHAPHSFAWQFLQWDLIKINITIVRNEEEPTHRVGQASIDLYLLDTFITGFIITSYLLNHPISRTTHWLYNTYIRDILLLILISTSNLITTLTRYVQRPPAPAHGNREQEPRPVRAPWQRGARRQRNRGTQAQTPHQHDSIPGTPIPQTHRHHQSVHSTQHSDT